MMTPDEIKAARHKLGLTVSQAAFHLGCSELHVRRLEMNPTANGARAISPAMEKLLQAYLDGYYPRGGWKGDRPPSR